MCYVVSSFGLQYSLYCAVIPFLLPAHIVPIARQYSPYCLLIFAASHKCLSIRDLQINVLSALFPLCIGKLI